MADVIITTWKIGEAKPDKNETDDSLVRVVFKLTHKKQRRLIYTPYKILPSQLKNERIVKHDEERNWNPVLTKKLSGYLSELAIIGDAADDMNIDQIKSRLINAENKTTNAGSITSGLNVFDCFRDYEEALLKKNKIGSARNYGYVRRTLRKWWGGEFLDFSSLNLEGMTDFHDSFDGGYYIERWEGKGKAKKKIRVHKDYSLDTTSIHERSIRAIFNREIKAKRLSADTYPFNEFKILENENPEHKDLTIERMWQIRDLDLNGEAKRIQEARDLFMLGFYLIGMNLIDFWHIDFTSLDTGTLRYIRRKTARPYSFTIPPEAMEILLRYKTADDENYFKVKLQRFDSLTHLVWLGLNRIAEILKMKKLTWNYCRHTWASLSQNKAEVSEDDARLALWPKKERVADRYNNKDLKRVDIANSKTIALIPKEKYGAIV